MRDSSHLKKQIQRLRQQIRDIENNEGYGCRGLKRVSANLTIGELWYEIRCLEAEIRDRS